MKKNTLLFATLLAMSGMAFGQVLPKVLLENTLDIPSTKKKAFVSVSNTSPLGNIIVSTEGDNDKSVRVFDNAGKLIWNSTDYYKNPTASFFTDLDNPKFTLLNCYYLPENSYSVKSDSVLILDENFVFLRGFDVHSPNTLLKKVEDGILYNNLQNILIKYDINGKEEWRYQNSNNINILTQKPPYFIAIENKLDVNNASSILILDKNGKRVGFTNPESIQTIFPTNDQGFWLETSADFQKKYFLKYDSTGKQTAKIKYTDFIPTALQIHTLEIMPDNSLNYIYLNSDAFIHILNFNTTGTIKNINRNIRNNSNKNSYRYLKTQIASDGTLMYSVTFDSLSLYSNGSKRTDFMLIIGAEKINDSQFGWFKRVASSNITIPEVNFETINEKLFQVVNTLEIVGTNNINRIQYFNIDGSLKWTYENTIFRFYLVRRIENLVYLYSSVLSNGNSYLYVLDYKTGNLLWKGNDIDLSFFANIFIDKNKNQYISYRNTDCFTPQCYTQKIQVLKENGVPLWQYSYKVYPDGFISPYYGNYSFSLAKNGIINTVNLETKINSQEAKYIFRKITPCSYNFSTALGPIVATSQIVTQNGLTEVCPTEKIKVTAPKFQGVVYEWTRDGKIVSELKDNVYDVDVSGTYKVTIKDTVCLYSGISNEVKVTIRTLATAQIQAPKTTFCEGEKTTITSTTNGTFFQWQKDEKDIPNATSGIFEVSQTGSYRVGVRDEKCPQLGFSNIIPIAVKALPEATISTDIKTVIYEPFTVKMTANTGTNLSYQWLKNDTLIANANTKIYEAKKSGKYNVIVTKEGCLKTSEALNIIIQIPLANEGEIGEEIVQIYPNPSRGEFKIILPKSLKGANIQLFDLLGRERTILHTGEQTQAVGLVQGTYFLRVNMGEKSIVNKIVIE